jgi:chemotaxis family two-component system response regulator Rcp1
MANPFLILLVEDNPTDALLVQEGLRRSRVLHECRLVKDGLQALAFLRQKPPYENAPRPDLVLLDIQLPDQSGLDVLTKIKTDPVLARTPVIILTSSDDERDVLLAYDRHANSYIVKPVIADEFFNAIQKIETFWLTIVKVPAQTRKKL